jgi:GT2 family glycosyltransferase
VIRPDRPLPPHEARNRGAGLASGETIVFTDADCVPRPDWLERLLDGHRLGAPLIGGAIDPDGGGIVERGADICKFALWLEGLPGGERETLPTANLSLTRETWARIGPFRLLAWSGDTELCRRARREGVPLHFEPRAIVRHEDPVRLGRFLRERRQRGSAYAALRIELESWPRLRSAAYAAGSPAIAVWLAARGAWAAARSGRALTALVSLPVSAAGFVAWTLGEAGAYGRHAVGRLSSGDGRPGSPPHGG